MCVCCFGIVMFVMIYDFNFVVVYCDWFYVFVYGCVVVFGVLDDVLIEVLLCDVFGVVVFVDCYFVMGWLCIMLFYLE